MTPIRKKNVTVGVVFTALGMFAGAFLNWSATERRLSVHIATADDRVGMMCELAEYQMRSTELVCEANRVQCPRPPELQREVLARRCR